MQKSVNDHLNKQTLVILSVTSDIGFALTQNYLRAGHQVIGTYRSTQHLNEISGHPNLKLLKCDFSINKSMTAFIYNFKKINKQWNTLISCIGEPRPLTGFFDTNFDVWQKSVEINALSQLRILHRLYKYRNPQQISNVVFFAGGGVNNAVVNFSAYTIAKIMLIKMCEFIDAENPDLNIFIVGPGWTKTKIHKLILNDPNITSTKREETLTFLKKSAGTDINYIYECINWLSKSGKKVASGRNFALAHDPLQKCVRSYLSAALKADPNMYKIRRLEKKLVKQLTKTI